MKRSGEDRLKPEYPTPRRKFKVPSIDFADKFIGILSDTIDQQYRPYGAFLIFL